MTKKLKMKSELLELKDINQLGRNYSKIVFFSCGFIELMFVSKSKVLRDFKNRTLIFL